MSPPDREPTYAPLFIDVPAVAALAARCARSLPALPGPQDAQVARFMRMASGVDPRPMLLDEDFDLRLRFDMFSELVEPLVVLAQCYGDCIDWRRPRDDRFTVYIPVLTLTVRTLCAGLELFAAIRTSMATAADPARTTIADAAGIFESELSQLLAGVAEVLERQDLLSLDEVVALGCAVVAAPRRLRPAAWPSAPEPPRMSCR
jgi:hypothetical protein